MIGSPATSRSTVSRTPLRSSLGSEGRTATFTRASTAWYTDDSGVVQSVLSGAARHSPTRGILIEEARTNLALRSDALDNASWSTQALSGAAAPVITANAAVAPDGTTTAEQIVFGATASDGQNSIVFQSASPGAAFSHSIYLRTVTGTGTVYLAALSGGGAWVGRTACALTTTWARFSLPNVGSGVAHYFVLGPDTRDPSQPDVQAAVTLYAWRAQYEVGPFSTSSIQTAGSTVQRVAETLTVPTTGFPALEGAVEAVVTPQWTNPGADAYVLDTRTGSSGVSIFVDSAAKLNGTTGDGSNTTTVQSAALTWTVGTSYCVRLEWRAGNVYLYRDGVLVASAVAGTAYRPTAHAATMGIGATVAGASQVNAWVRDVAVFR